MPFMRILVRLYRFKSFNLIFISELLISFYRNSYINKY